MATITRFEEIEAWKTARQLTKVVYQTSDQGTFARDFGLRDQMRRAAVSIMSNIAEGFESRTRLMFLDYLGRAKASAGELRAQCYVALDVGHIDRARFDSLLTQVECCSGQRSRFVRYLEGHSDPSCIREDGSDYSITNTE